MSQILFNNKRKCEDCTYNKFKMVKFNDIPNYFKKTEMYEIMIGNLETNETYLPVNTDYYLENLECNNFEDVMNILKAHFYYGFHEEPVFLFDNVNDMTHKVTNEDIINLKINLPEDPIIVKEILLILEFKNDFGIEAIKKSFIDLYKFALKICNYKINHKLINF